MRIFLSIIVIGIMSVASGINYTPIPAIPCGTIDCIVGEPYRYWTQAVDFEGDQFRYEFDWNDGTRTITDFKPSDKVISETHTWKSAGTFWIRTRTIDVAGKVSDWSGCRAIYAKYKNRT